MTSDRYTEKLEKQLEKIQAELKEAQLYEDIVEQILEFLVHKIKKHEVSGNPDMFRHNPSMQKELGKVEIYQEIAGLIQRMLEND